jgi:poly(beta-D-mannuronate) lyase
MLKYFTLLLFTIIVCTQAKAQTALQTSFETAQGYTTGNLNTQNGWALTNGTAVVTTAKAKTGTQSINLSAAGTALLLNYVAYGNSVPGITGEVYVDMWINPASFATKGIAVNGYDLFGGSSKRIFVIEFGTDNTVKAYNSSAAVNVGTWVANQWIRISLKIDFATEKYKVAINGLIFGTDMSFRETYTPTASGTRVANVKEFHSLRFNHTNDTQVATSDAAVDDIYIGTTPIADIDFGSASTLRTITVTQPQYGSIALSPAAPYVLNQTVTATLTLPQGYMNNGWTGDLSGTQLVKPFTVTGNMAFSADVGIDISNPPPKYLITVNQPANGTITLSPASSDNMYYKETQVTATISYEACYQFNGWTGDLSGIPLTKTFTVQNNMTIGGDITLNNTPATNRIVTTVMEFKNALTAMNPGDTVIVENGTYNLSSLAISRSGCSLRPLVIMARNTGQAILNGATALVFKGLKYTTFKGFSFQSANIGTGVKLEACNHFRLTENNFALTESTSCTWVYIGDVFASPDPIKSGYNRVDHNIFNGKTQAGNYVRMDGNINQQSQYDTIDHNHFMNNGPRADNEKESIRVGVSTLSKSSGFTIIEYNLFEDCDGDPEVVSIKSCDNTIRYNTFVRCLGTLCLRQGFRSVVEGNYFFGEGKTAIFNGGVIGCGGIRVYAKDHKIINNYFHELTGYKWDAAITITNGDVTNASASLADHYLPENLTVAFNTFVNNKSDIEIGFDNGGSYPLKPINCVVANNVVINNTNPIIKSYSAASLAGVSFSNNIMYPTGTSSIGISTTPAEINSIDPKLVQPVCIAPANCLSSNAYKVMRLGAGSPAIDASTGTYSDVVMDYERQPRSGTKDIGADEYTAASPVTVNFTAMDAEHTGPGAIAQSYTYNLSGAPLPVQLLQFTAVYQNKATLLQWKVSEELNVKQYAVEWSRDGITYTILGYVSATGSYSNYLFHHASPAAGKNFYRLRMIDMDGHFKFSAVCTIDVAANGSVTVYPNPAKAILNVTVSAAYNNVSLRLVNAMGMVVKEVHTLTTGSNRINVQDIAAGVYIVELLSDGKKNYSGRVIIN